ncbi:hypothetical protein B6U91_00440 [Candidatus Pacearchaeota archaeon ex4484_71]|nr:MAG: hypothetical protein B6U91_00440 [Candidatus Pacearchaeota archaeon ex4484_71]
MGELEDFSLEGELTEEARKQRNLLIKQKQEEFERKQLMNVEEEVKKSVKKKVNFNWRLWLVVLLVLFLLGALVYFLGLA